MAVEIDPNLRFVQKVDIALDGSHVAAARFGKGRPADTITIPLGREYRQDFDEAG